MPCWPRSGTRPRPVTMRSAGTWWGLRVPGPMCLVRCPCPTYLLTWLLEVTGRHACRGCCAAAQPPTHPVLHELESMQDPSPLTGKLLCWQGRRRMSCRPLWRPPSRIARSAGTTGTWPGTAPPWAGKTFRTRFDPAPGRSCCACPLVTPVPSMRVSSVAGALCMQDAVLPLLPARLCSHSEACRMACGLQVWQSSVHEISGLLKRCQAVTRA